MIKAITKIDDEKPETAILLWQWLQEEPFKFSGRMYLLKREDCDYLISIYYDIEGNRNSYHSTIHPTIQARSLDLFCKGAEVTIILSNDIAAALDLNHVKTVRWDGLYLYRIDRVDATFNLTSESAFKKLLYCIRELLPR